MLSEASLEAAGPPQPEALPAYLADLAGVRARLGGTPGDWTVTEIGDGNMNWVYRVDGPDGRVCVKLARPYIRAIGPGWPMTADRLAFEAAALEEHGRHARGLVPETIHADPGRHVLVMEHLDGFRVMRHALLDGPIDPAVGPRLAEYAARAHLGTSVWGLPATAYRRALARFSGNAEMAEATEQVIFRDCYHPTTRVRWVTPDLDDLVTALRTETGLKLAVSRLKARFLGLPQGLLHGDLHTGSMMIRDNEVKVIDHEFALHGPFGFDTGMLLANLLIALFAAPAHARGAADLRERDRCLRALAGSFWTGYRQRFLDGWPAAARRGEAYDPAVLGAEAEVEMRREAGDLLGGIERDALGFCGVEMIRRTVGLSHVEDWTGIADTRLRARLQRPALDMARCLISRPEPPPDGLGPLLDEAVARRP